MVGQQHFDGEADSFSLEDAVSVVESQDVCVEPKAASAPEMTRDHDGRGGSLTDSRLLAGQRAILRHQVSVVPLAGQHLLHLSRLPPFALSVLQKHPETDVGALGGELPPARGERRGSTKIQVRASLI